MNVEPINEYFCRANLEEVTLGKTADGRVCFFALCFAPRRRARKGVFTLGELCGLCARPHTVASGDRIDISAEVI